MFSLRRIFGIFILSSSIALAACSGTKTEASYPGSTSDALYKHGSVLGQEGFTILGEDSKKDQDTGVGVNAYLWRASLDTLSFMPITSADPFGGVILTDWYSTPNAPGQRSKVNVYILDRQLRADGIRVTVFRQERNKAGQWYDVPASKETATRLEDTILTRARQMRIAHDQNK